jgi:hypothetical protein
MRQVISAPPTIDVEAFARRIAGPSAVIRDPSRALCERYGYQTLYEVPIALQKRMRRELIRSHTEALRADADAVCDHSVFAWLADWMRWIWSETTTQEWDSVLVEALPAFDRSEVIHHVVEGPRAAYDGYRWLDSGNGAQVERIMRSIYIQAGCEARVIETVIGKEMSR